MSDTVLGLYRAEAYSRRCNCVALGLWDLRLYNMREHDLSAHECTDI